MIKKILKIGVMFLLLLSFSELRAQHYIGINGGGGGGSIRIKPSQETGTLTMLPSFGVTYKYHGTEMIVGGIQADLQYMQSGFKILPRVDSDSSYQRRTNTVMLPVMWQPHVYFAKKTLCLFLNAGPYLNYNISSNEKFVSKSNGVIYDRNYPLESLRDNRLGYGLIGGGGFSATIKKFIIQAEFRYIFGFSDILKNRNKYKDNPYESPVDQMNVTIGLYYKIGKQSR